MCLTQIAETASFKSYRLQLTSIISFITFVCTKLVYNMNVQCTAATFQLADSAHCEQSFKFIDNGKIKPIFIIFYVKLVYFRVNYGKILEKNSSRSVLEAQFIDLYVHFTAET